jgi:hypothetical protein
MNQDSNSLNPTQKQTVDSRLARYALAGGVLLGVPAAAHAGVVYTPGPFHAGPGQTVSVNLDPLIDATTDLSIFATGTSTSSQWIGLNSTGSFFTNGLNPLLFGDAITLLNTNSGAGTLMKATFPGPTYSFPWGGVANGSSHYLGIKFLISGQQHLGWAEIAMEKDEPSVTIKGVAYESIPQASILAGDTGVPEPSSLMLFAAGAAGILALRRKRGA